MVEKIEVHFMVYVHIRTVDESDREKRETFHGKYIHKKGRREW